MARHAARKNPMPASGTRRALLRAGLTVTAAGAAVAAGAVTASAAPAEGVDTSGPVQTLTQAVNASTTYGLGPAKDLQLDPLAGTGVDPLDNVVGTQVADFKPVDTGMVTDPLTSGSSLSELPVVGPATGVLPG
ncbi:hypothetical protein [Streptomyces sp. cg35]|uniref:hypothetical protein n=1 Tax=Streptomyces sp. cg35 TaxID=3421650 RepID=UPI003D16E8BC